MTGLQTNEDGSPINLLPHILIYDDSTINNVIPGFAALIEKYRASGEIPLNNKYPFKAVCWNAKSDGERIKLPSYYPSFDTSKQRQAVNHTCLESALNPPVGSSDKMRLIVLGIQNAILLILRLENVRDSTGKFYNKTGFNEMMEKLYRSDYEVYRTLLYKSAEKVCKEDTAGALADLRAWIPQLLALFSKAVVQSNRFINDPYTINGVVGGSQTGVNQYPGNGFVIDVNTVHAVKGQTHTATLYMESYYERDVRNSGNHESERLAEIIMGNGLPTAPIQKWTAQSLKMAYVGFSRPTHLLCFAIHKDRYDARWGNLPTREWTVESV